MKRLVSILFAIVCAVSISAQTNDNVGHNVISLGGADNISSGEYLVDLDLFAASQPTLPELDLSVEAILRAYDSRLHFNPDLFYGDMASVPNYFTFIPVGIFSPNEILQAATFNLKSGGTLTTYGNYKADGTRTTYVGVPWGKNDFTGGLQLKSASGNFSFSFEVRYEQKNGMWR